MKVEKPRLPMNEETKICQECGKSVKHHAALCPMEPIEYGKPSKLIALILISVAITAACCIYCLVS